MRARNGEKGGSLDLHHDYSPLIYIYICIYIGVTVKGNYSMSNLSSTLRDGGGMGET